MYEQIESTNKLLQADLQDSIKPIMKSSTQSNHPLSSVNGDKLSMLKYKLANIARFGTIGNDNSSDSGYEEVQDKLLIAQMPPPDVMQTL
jgi:hypothetical protein